MVVTFGVSLVNCHVISKIVILGEGGPGQTARKELEQRFFVVLVVVFFLVLNLFYSLQRGSNGLITEKTILFQGSRGGPTFPGGPTFSRGSFVG